MPAKLNPKGRGSKKTASQGEKAPGGKPPKAPKTAGKDLKTPKGSKATRTSPRKNAPAEKQAVETSAAPLPPPLTPEEPAEAVQGGGPGTDAAVGDDATRALAVVMAAEDEADEADEAAAAEKDAVGKGKGRGKGTSAAAAGAPGAVVKRVRKDYSLSVEEEATMFEWLRETEYLWKRGHRQFKEATKKNAAWDEMAQKMGYTREHLQGWWRGVHTWYVKLHKVKSGSAAKVYSDREADIMRDCSFYEKEVKHRFSKPMKSFSASTPLPNAPVHSGSDEHSRPPSPAPALGRVSSVVEDEDVLTSLEATRPSQETPSSSQGNRGTKRSREDTEYLQAISDSLKCNNELLQKLVVERPKSSRDAFITYVGDTLRDMESKEYATIKLKIISLITHLGEEPEDTTSDELPSMSPRRSRTRPTPSRSAPAAAATTQSTPDFQGHTHQPTNWTNWTYGGDQPYSQMYHPANPHQYPQQQYRQEQSTSPQFITHAASTATATAGDLSGVLAQASQVIGDTSQISLGNLSDYPMPSPGGLNLSGLNDLRTPPQAPATTRQSPAARVSGTSHVPVSAPQDTEHQAIVQDLRKKAEEMADKEPESPGGQT